MEFKIKGFILTVIMAACFSYSAATYLDNKSLKEDTKNLLIFINHLEYQESYFIEDVEQLRLNWRIFSTQKHRNMSKSFVEDVDAYLHTIEGTQGKENIIKKMEAKLAEKQKSLTF